MSLRDDLIAAKALIADPAKWVKEDGGDQLSCWCAATACKSIAMTYGVHYMKEWGRLTRALERQFPAKLAGWSLPEFNDWHDTTHADIMALFDRAIEAAERSK